MEKGITGVGADAGNAGQAKIKKAIWWALGGMAALAVITAAPDPEAGQLPAPDPAQPSAAAVDDLREAMQPIGGRGTIFAFGIPAGTRGLDVEAAAREHCAARDFCQIYGWQDASQIPGAWPMLDREVAALSFRYALNRSSGLETADWYCGSIGAAPDCTRADAN